MRSPSVASVLLACVLASGCASFVAPSYAPDYGAIDDLKRLNLAKAAVENGRPGDPSAQVNKVSLRGAGLTAGASTFASYVSQAMQSDLQEARLYDPAAARRIALTLTRNELDVSGFSEGTGRIEVELLMTQNGATLLSKTYAAKTTFESSFAGAVAIPKGQIEYPNLVRALLATIYRDPAFQSAMQNR